ncbi:hypothetical protein [Flexithrix dorotheae]|uniref:hypothetical protein n=1 Tax=Flexithrix dorotheae TaxID=70993 RepID=UPI000373628C|nr:hypothetical protein [Flexithrix dorotheae]
MMALKLIKIIFFFLIITVITQVGGIIYFCTLFFDSSIKKYSAGKRIFYKTGIFLSLYLVATFTIIPILAEKNGRVPLPVNFGNLKPLTIWTCLLNRHYVKPELKILLEEVSESMNGQYPGTGISYLDANFPFFNGFPLLPHLSHEDGKKLDLAFYYYDDETGKGLDYKAPSPIGYGGFEGPKKGEQNMPEICQRKGFWQYGILGEIIPNWVFSSMKFDEKRTKKLIIELSRRKEIKKIFIEPHLRTRLGLNTGKVRFHGCHAVRHDDHIHIEI